MNRDSLRKSPLSKDKDPSTIGEDDMAKVAAEEGEIEIAKDFDVVPISDGLVWQAKGAPAFLLRYRAPAAHAAAPHPMQRSCSTPT